MRRGYDGATLVHLAEAAGLSKASLYHHFPGGKPEMAATLVRFAIADLEQKAFACLQESGDPDDRLLAFINGFAEYVDHGRASCLLAVLAHHEAASEAPLVHQQAIALQFREWHARLAQTFKETGVKRKRARREAHELIAQLYGALLNARLHGDPNLFTLGSKRLLKTYAQK